MILKIILKILSLLFNKDKIMVAAIINAYPNEEIVFMGNTDLDELTRPSEQEQMDLYDDSIKEKDNRGPIQ